MSIDSIQQKLVTFLQTVTGNTALDVVTDLHACGATDSLTMMDLLVFIESEYRLRLEFGDLTPEAFSTVQSLSRLIAARIAQPPSSFAA